MRFDTGCPCCRDDFYDYEEWLMQRVSFVSHPLALDTLARLRDPAMNAPDFARRLRALGALIACRALEEESLAARETDAPGASLLQPTLDLASFVFAPVSAEAAEVVAGASALAPAIAVTAVGAHGEEVVRDRFVVCFAATLTNGEAEVALIAAMKDSGARAVRYACALAAPEGIEKLRCAHPDVEIWVVGIDSHLDAEGRLAPGIGDVAARVAGAR